MTRSNGETLGRLASVLDIYGADPSRWPPEEREALLAASCASAEGARLLAEARALDQVMAHAPAGRARPALVRRIVAAAETEGRLGAAVVPLPTVTAAAARSPRGMGGRHVAGPAAALLAASFALGLYLGVAGMAEPALDTAFGPVALVVPEDVEGGLLGPVDALAVDQEELL